jgi:Protein of unknown function (DUF2924)
MKAAFVDMLSFDLTNLAAAELEKLWRLHLSERVPDHLPRSLLSRLLAYRLQVEQRGELSKKTIAYLRVIEADIRAGKESETPYPSEQKLKPGCQLRREHEGVHHCITILDGGYEWESKTYPSLSSVAKAITGTNWNGHRFFGLKTKVQPAVGTAP